MIQSTGYKHELPPLMCWNQIELKLSLEDLCHDFGIHGDMEMDDGNSFSYNVTIEFPKIFNRQVIKTQFMPYDSIPQLLNPAEIGNRDPMGLLEENKKKYGNAEAGSSNLEQIEIERQMQRLKIEFINHVEKSLFGEFNNGQLPDFPTVRLRECYWLPYVCFKPQISS